jgi:hypothetical protein
MMVNGTLTKFMEKEFIFPATETGTKDPLTTGWERAMDQYSIETAIATKANGNKISFGDMVFFTLKMAITMKEVSLMETLKASAWCFSWELEHTRDISKTGTLKESDDLTIKTDLFTMGTGETIRKTVTEDWLRRTAAASTMANGKTIWNMAEAPLFKKVATSLRAFGIREV